MAARSLHVVALLAWIFPLLLLLLSASLAKDALEIKRTLETGMPVTAEITDAFTTNRVDVTYDYVSLRTTLPDGRVVTREKLSLPRSLYPPLEGRQTVAARVLPGAAEEIVIVHNGAEPPVLIGRPQYRIAAINAVMALVGALVLVVGVFWWNRYLRRQGDPAQRAPAQRAPASESELEGGPAPSQV